MRKNILVITFFSFKDALMQTYTLPYVEIIRNTISPSSSLFLVSFEQNPNAVSTLEQQELKRYYKSKGIQLLFFKYQKNKVLLSLYFLGVLGYLFFLILFKRIHVIHSWAANAGVLSSILSVITGRKLVVDSCEPQAESMVENGSWQKGSTLFKILFFFERFQVKRASTVIAGVEGMKGYIKDTYKLRLPQNVYTKPACVNLEMFDYALFNRKEVREELRIGDEITMVYAGKFGGIYYDKEVFQFIQTALNFWGEQRFKALILSNISDNELHHYLASYHIPEKCVIKKFVAHSEIPRHIAVADFAITPVKPVYTKRFCAPIKDGEYWAMGLPVVITPHISNDSELIEKYQIGSIWKEASAQGCLCSIKEIDSLLQEDRKDLQKRIREVAMKHRNFATAKQVYQQVYGA